jgi:predicted kinase
MEKALMYKEFINESINDKNTFKAVLLAGGPGSGKSYIGDLMFGNKFSGMKMVNVDDIFTFFLKKNNLPLIIDETDEEMYAQQQVVRDFAKKLNKNVLFNSMDGVLPICIDGTGAESDKIEKITTTLVSIGYDVSMLFVDTSLKTAQKRNSERERVVPDSVVAEKWYEVRNNYQFYWSYYGDEFYRIENDEYYPRGSAEAVDFVQRLYKQGMKILTRPLKNPIGIELTKLMREQKVKYLSELDLDEIPNDIRTISRQIKHKTW